MKTMAEYLKELRDKREWSQRDAAAACNWKQPKISKLENGQQQPTLSDIGVIARTFGVSVQYLIKLRTAA